MSEVHGNEQDVFVKHILRQFMKEQLHERTEDKKDNSFIFLENRTLNMLIIYMLMNSQRFTSQNDNRDAQVEILEELERIIVDNKKDFEEIITLLKEQF
ncbi:hypothetical protein MKY34_10115 [Sporosarcina sp. FSL K6-1522]|uniref:hypothetical protein n=1 Tax=Sporosarcina sp. FSL K6-1522 TaxID=2921554 RepID=UPI00315B3CBA